MNTIKMFAAVAISGASTDRDGKILHCVFFMSDGVNPHAVISMWLLPVLPFFTIRICVEIRSLIVSV